MSNDSSYKITVSGDGKQIEEMLEYLEEKACRWEAWQKKHKRLDSGAWKKAFEKVMKDLGFTQPGEFVTWRFWVEQKKKQGKKATVILEGWANENFWNTPISGPKGELAALYKKFPDLDYDVEYADSYSKGSCSAPDFVKDFAEDREEGYMDD